MARPKSTKNNTKAANKKNSQTETSSEKSSNPKFITKVQSDLENKNAVLNLILGALIILVGAVLIFNYLNKPKEEVGPTQQIEASPTTGDVTKDKLPGTYTVKEGDTLFDIAQQYYNDGYRFSDLIRENRLSGETISVGQVIIIPKLEITNEASPSADAIAQASVTASPTMTPTPSPTPSPTLAPSPSVTPAPTNQPSSTTDTGTGLGTGGAENQTVWGEKITVNTYTVQPGDWLSKISGRAYGDIFAYQKLAQANGITNPDQIEVGMVLKIPR